MNYHVFFHVMFSFFAYEPFASYTTNKSRYYLPIIGTKNEKRNEFVAAFTTNKLYYSRDERVRQDKEF